MFLFIVFASISPVQPGFYGHLLNREPAAVPLTQLGGWQEGDWKTLENFDLRAIKFYCLPVAEGPTAGALCAVDEARAGWGWSGDYIWVSRGGGGRARSGARRCWGPRPGLPRAAPGFDPREMRRGCPRRALAAGHRLSPGPCASEARFGACRRRGGHQRTPLADV